MELQAVRDAIAENTATLLYVTTTDCSVCKVLKPKVRQMLSQRFPKMGFIDIEMDVLPGAGHEFEVFSVPTVIGFFDGKEHFRKVRVFGLEELAEALARPYEILFEE